MHTFELLLILVAASVALAYAAQRRRLAERTEVGADPRPAIPVGQASFENNLPFSR